MSFGATSDDCPICLEPLNVSEEVFTLPCRNCEYNFCSKCAETFVRSSQDDYQVASDGSLQVKVHVACPQCRSKYPMDLLSVLLLRKAHTLGTTITDEDSNFLHDSELTATQLSLKRDLHTQAKRRQVERAHGMYLQVMDGKLSTEMIEDAEKTFQVLFQGLPDPDTDGANENEEGAEEEVVDKPRKKSVDVSLFQGLQDCMGRDERVFLTELLTSGEIQQLAQAAMILHGILRLSVQSSSVLQNLAFETKRHSKHAAEQLEKIKVAFPLPNHMPGYFVVPSYNSKQQYLNLADFEWDGSITPPPRSNRIFDKVYGDYYHPPNLENPRPVVVVKSVKGPAGRVGLRREDIITHVNDMEWTGTAQELSETIHQIYEQRPNEEITLTVNANPETAKFLKIRHEMLEKSQFEISP